MRDNGRRRGALAAAGLAVALAGACTPDAGPAGPVPPGNRCSTLAERGPLVAEQSTIFLGGDEYPVYRIPSVTTTSSGVVLAFAEARQTEKDPGAGRIDLVMRRSVDCGRTWEPQVRFADNGIGDAHNPTSLVAPGPDGRETTFVFYNQRPDHPGGEFDILAGLSSSWVRTSTDDGATWSEPRELTGLAEPNWRVTSFGPGQAIVTRWGNDTAPAGRIIVPGWYSLDGSPNTGSFVIYSDDGGTTWQRGEVPARGTNEAQVIELADGTIVLDARRNSNVRTVSRSADGGETWSTPEDGLAMVPIMSGLLRDRAVRDGDPIDRIWHTGISTGGRYDLRVWSSRDEGVTWSPPIVLLRAPAQYSMLTPLGDGTLGAIYEATCLCQDPDTGEFRAGLGVRMLRFDPERIDPSTAAPAS